MTYRTSVAFIAIFLFGFCGLATGNEVDLQRARTVAQNWLYHMKMESGPRSSMSEIKGEEIIEYDGQVVGYNFLLSSRGHIVVPFRDELPPVKLYSDTVTLSMGEDSDVAQWISEELFKINEALNAHAEELKGIDFTQTPNGQLWASFEIEPSLFPKEYLQLTSGAKSVSIGPLLSTTWGQNSPYNGDCPTGDGGVTLVGCVATAASQIMKYWEHPSSGIGSHSYTWDGDDSCDGSTPSQTLSATFSDSYDWANMLDSYSDGYTATQAQAVAELSYEVGVAVEMDYGVCSSGTSTMNVADILPTYFAYDSTISKVYRSSYSNDHDWMLVFKDEVENGRPAQLRLRDPSEGGHSVVVDGYQDTPVEMVHLSLGWTGSWDGWYATNNIVTGGYDWSDINYQAAVIGIKPDHPSCPSLYYWNGDEYVNRGFILGGAIPKENEYVDNVRVKGSKLVPEDGSYWLQIRETEPERSFIDALRIRVVDAGGVTADNSATGTCTEAEAHGFKLRSTAAKEFLSILAILNPTSAEHSKLGDVLRLLERPDDKYARLRTGDIITLSFPCDPYLGEEVDFVFDVKGYYEALK